MRTRNHKVQFWVNDDEHHKLARYAAKTKMTKSAYLRRIINGYLPKEAPPFEYHQMMRELRSIGNNLNQLTHRAHVIGTIDYEVYEENARKVAALTAEMAQVFLPEKIGK